MTQHYSSSQEGWQIWACQNSLTCYYTSWIDIVAPRPSKPWPHLAAPGGVVLPGAGGAPLAAVALSVGGADAAAGVGVTEAAWGATRVTACTGEAVLVILCHISSPRQHEPETTSTHRKQRQFKRGGRHTYTFPCITRHVGLNCFELYYEIRISAATQNFELKHNHTQIMNVSLCEQN